MKVFLFNPNGFEHWDFRNPDHIGIGNSETSAVELSWRLARMGHEVTVYAPIPPGCPRHDGRGVAWLPLQAANLHEDGFWLLYRSPKSLDAMAGPEKGQRIYLVCQDEDYPGEVTEERAAKLEKAVTLCKGQERHWKGRYPFLAGKVARTSNGLRPELVAAIMDEQWPRDPYRLVYASSPDRALAPLVKIFTRAREIVPQLSLHVYYGMDNIEKIQQKCEALKDDAVDGPAARRMLKRFATIRELFRTPGLVSHGRTPQPDLYRAFAQGGLSVYPCSHFRETGFVAGMEAQALGCVPIWGGPWAVEEHILGGSFIPGDCWQDPLTKARFVAELVRMATDHEMQAAIRKQIMPQALERFSIQRFAEQWDRWIRGIPDAEEAPESTADASADDDDAACELVGKVAVQILPSAKDNCNLYRMLPHETE